MNREIKFRAWLKEKKMMAEYISHFKHSPNCGIFEITIPFDESGLQTFRKLHSINQFDLMQYTGLKDNNGKEIYEGDINSNDNNERSEVVFYAGGFYLKKNKTEYQHIGKNAPFNLNVIGNIYENPDLISQ